MSKGTATEDVRRSAIPGSTASGLASPAQLIDVTPFVSISFGQTATELTLVIGERVATRAERKVVPISPYLNRDDEPLLRASMEAVEGEW